jgi:hypothetical protein
MSDLPIRKKTIEERIADINAMTHEEMAHAWRFAPPGMNEMFDTNSPLWPVFKERFFTHFGGLNPEISKRIGWSQYDT